MLLYYNIDHVFPGQSDASTWQPRSLRHLKGGARGAARGCGRGRRAPAADADGRQAAGHEEEEARVPAVPEATGAAESPGTEVVACSIM